MWRDDCFSPRDFRDLIWTQLPHEAASGSPTQKGICFLCESSESTRKACGPQFPLERNLSEEHCNRKKAGSPGRYMNISIENFVQRPCELDESSKAWLAWFSLSSFPGQCSIAQTSHCILYPMHYLSVCLSTNHLSIIYLFITHYLFISIHPPTHPFIHSSSIYHLSIPHLSIHLPIHLSSIYPFTHLSRLPSFYPPVYHIHSSIYSPIYPSIHYMFTYPSI